MQDFDIRTQYIISTYLENFWELHEIKFGLESYKTYIESDNQYDTQPNLHLSKHGNQKK